MELKPIVSETDIPLPLARIFSDKDTAKKLADLYLPTHLRDFFLGMHPILQCHLYELSQEPAEFFTFVLIEWSRYDNAYARNRCRPHNFATIRITTQEITSDTTQPPAISMDSIPPVENIPLPKMLQGPHNPNRDASD